MIKHLIWDWNGTLLDDVAACVAAINILLRRQDLPLVDVDRYREVFCFPVRRYYEILGFQLSPAAWDRIAHDYHVLYAELAASAALRDSVTATLAGLQARGLTLSVLSASELGLLRRMLTERGLPQFFPRIKGLTNFHAHSKVELGRELVAEAGVAPADTVLIGDTIHDFEVARELGCRCVLLTGGHQSAHRLRQCACPVLESVPAAMDWLERAEATKSKDV